MLFRELEELGLAAKGCHFSVLGLGVSRGFVDRRGLCVVTGVVSLVGLRGRGCGEGITPDLEGERGGELGGELGREG